MKVKVFKTYTGVEEFDIQEINGKKRVRLGDEDGNLIDIVEPKNIMKMKEEDKE